MRDMHHHGSAHFDHWASGYDRSFLQRIMFRPVHTAALDALRAAAGAPHDVLDVGCGTGRLLEAAAGLWPEARLTGIDVSHAMIAEARRKHEGEARFTFQQGDAADLPLEAASFDAAFSTVSFHHWADQAAGLRSVVRVLRPGGVFVLADVDLPLLRLIGPLVNRSDHAKFLRPEAIRSLLEQAGLSVVSRRRLWALLRMQVVVTRKS
jgi:ubiquinone/menaquinone biosynthesis C-methylase UbiE